MAGTEEHMNEMCEIVETHSLDLTTKTFRGGEVTPRGNGIKTVNLVYLNDCIK